MAVLYGKADVARLLVEEGAAHSLKNDLGLTAIDFARQADRADMVDLVAQAVRRRQPNRGQW
jgi:ankyrin repeat protein